MTNRNIAFVGAGLLAVGLFTPIVTLPIMGSINFLSGFYGYILLALAALSVALAAKSRERDLIWTGSAAAGAILYSFVRLQYMISSMRSAMADQLAGNPFAGFAQLAVSSVQLQWGWLPVATGAALLIYAGVKSRVDDERLFSLSDQTSKIVAGLSALALLTGPAIDLVKASESTSMMPGQKSVEKSTVAAPNAADISADAAPTNAEQAAYIARSLKLYDLTAGYHDTYSGRKAGVNFKIKNTGNRTLNQVTVRVEFFDAQGNAIAEEEYTPVIVSEYNIGDNNPLRPNYIYQQEPDKFWVGENVPTEWAEGKAKATITQIEFAPNS
jgi:hypothetical protein